MAEKHEALFISANISPKKLLNTFKIFSTIFPNTIISTTF